MPILEFLPPIVFQHDQPSGPAFGTGRPFLYTLSTCIHCKHAKELFNRLNVTYDYIDVDTLSREESPKIMAELGKYNPDNTFPTIIIGSEIIIGYAAGDIKKALAQLNNEPGDARCL